MNFAPTSRIRRAAVMLGESADLLLTLRPGSGRSKIFRSPDHAGGPRTKFFQLSQECAKRGEPYSRLICLSSVRVPLPLLRLLKALGARITVNQNGVYYPLWSHDFEKRNAFLRELNSQAHHTFFQSEFARASFERWVGPVPASHSLLYNAVDRRFYSPDWSRKTDRSHLRVLLFQDFREINRELWDFHLKLIQGAPAGVEWVILGRAESSALEAKVRSEVGGRPVTWELNPSAERVAKILPSSDVAFHFVHNDVCPNKVLECLASGVYVICSSAGGSRELVARGGGEALPTEESYERRTFPETALVWAALERFSADPETKRLEAHAASAAFDLPPWVKAMTAPPGG